MTGFGEQLRTQRDQRGFSLEALCAATKIQEKYLRALEEEDFLALPGGVFRKGIVRAYLAATGLDESTWMPRFQQSFEARARELGQDPEPDPTAWTEFAENVNRNRVSATRSNRVRWLGVLMLLLLLLAGAWAAWHFVLRFRLEKPAPVAGLRARQTETYLGTPREIH